MRNIGSLSDPELARRFGDYLSSQGIRNSVEHGSGGWSLWVNEETQVERAAQEFDRFQAEPGHTRYREARGATEQQRRQEAEEYARFKANQVEVRKSWSGRAKGFRPIAFLMIGVCIMVAGLTKLGEGDSPVKQLVLFGLLPDDDEMLRRVQDLILRKGSPELDLASDPVVRLRQIGITGFERIAAGEVWRLFTPMFLHFGILHLIFNLFWLHDLGGQIEQVKGSLFFGILVLVAAAGSNVAQNLWNGPFFGGMSGVNYALFGFIWMKQRFQPREGLGLAPNTVPLMLGWLVLCMTGLMGPVANTAHVTGLLVGLAGGAVPRLWQRPR